jgi:hypothetical protein
MRKFLMLAPLAVAGCATAAPPPPPAPAQCRSESLGQFVGQPATQQLGADMLSTSGARNLRWVGHGMMVTMDFSPERLTVWLTADNRVERANCG